MRPATTPNLDHRRLRHDALATRLAVMSDADLVATLAAEAVSWRASVHGSQSGVIEIEGTRVFVKQISLTALERADGGEGPTHNLFALPLFYQYGVGSAGFGAWRELKAYLKASAWALSGECPHFPVVYHWRVLPRSRPAPLSAEQRGWLDRAVSYWDGSDAVGARLRALSEATATIVLFLEHVPQMLDDWLRSRLESGHLDDAVEGAILRFHDQLLETAAFMNDRGLLHFDLSPFNVLTDDDQVYVTDFGLALSSDFELSPPEQAFFETHRLYDHCYVTWAFAQWLDPQKTSSALTPALTALIEGGAPVAGIFGRFLNGLSKGRKTEPYPAKALEAAVIAQASSRRPRR